MIPLINFKEDNNLVFIFRLFAIFILSIGVLIQYENTEFENYIVSSKTNENIFEIQKKIFEFL